jgi:hypothetical protein
MRKPFLFLPLLVLSISGLWYVQAQEKGQPYLLRLDQRKHDAEVKQRTHDQEPPELVVIERKGGAGGRPFPEPFAGKAASPAGPEKKPTEQDKLALAWNFYKKGRYDRAIPPRPLLLPTGRPRWKPNSVSPTPILKRGRPPRRNP